VLLEPLGYWRLLVDGAVYAGATIALGVLRPAATFAFAREVLQSRQKAAA
jgi:hypothetical protein